MPVVRGPCLPAICNFFPVNFIRIDESGQELVELNELSNYTALYVGQEGWTQVGFCQGSFPDRSPAGGRADPPGASVGRASA